MRLSNTILGNIIARKHPKLDKRLPLGSKCIHCNNGIVDLIVPIERRLGRCIYCINRYFPDKEQCKVLEKYGKRKLSKNELKSISSWVKWI